MTSAGQQTISDYTVGPTLVNVAVAFIVLELFFVGLWYVATYLKHRGVGLDDFCIPLALVFNLTLSVICIVMVKECYVGHHITWVLKNHPNGLTIYHKIQVAYPMIYALMCTFPKLAILGLYLRIFVEKRDRVASYVLMAVLSSWCVSIIIANGLQCIPIACLWNPAGHPNGHCFNINQFWKWFSFGNILTDFVMLLLPFPCIWKLRISRRDKIGLVITFCTGSVGFITAIVRFITFFEVINDGNQADFTFTSVKLSCVTLAEGGAYLIAACMPSYRSLFRKVRDHATTGTRTDRHGSRDITSLNSRHTNGNGFSRLDNEGKASTGKRDFVDSSSINSNLLPTGKIQVTHDVYVGSSSDF